VAWIKFEKDLLTDPRVLRMAKCLNARHQIIANPILADDSPDESVGNAQPLPAVTLVCGALVRLWCLADTHVDENDVLPLGHEDINKHIGVDGFCQIMPPEWMEFIDKDSVRLPNFHGHNGTEAKRKAVTQKRVAAFRVRNAPALPDQTKTRPRPKEEKAGAIALPAWVPEDAWKAWLEVRPKVKAPNTPRALSLALRDLEKLKESGNDPRAVLEAATMKGWRGLFPLKAENQVVPMIPQAKPCAYCSAPSQGSVNGFRYCGDQIHFQMAMDNERPARSA
jgi:hypothetical protein